MHRMGILGKGDAVAKHYAILSRAEKRSPERCEESIVAVKCIFRGRNDVAEFAGTYANCVLRFSLHRIME